MSGTTSAPEGVSWVLERRNEDDEDAAASTPGEAYEGVDESCIFEGLEVDDVLLRRGYSKM